MYEMIMFSFFFFLSHFSGWCTILNLMNCYVMVLATGGHLFKRTVVNSITTGNAFNVIGNFCVLCYSSPRLQARHLIRFRAFASCFRALVGIREMPIAGIIKPRR
ncbi:uncharacterized protein BO80DRAFT_203965 [Aspergillus ibericus CBS 121593]|uniref:Uncharacterized protein n=1 Tax=Aspergillus ibericus CBS 121593 TaxID=1448316 RepID=A0A395HAC2_9EURO|nr:hypothetical protein BO80DRAFT_203965 [Aspergillus ibericus CBS 121593]RAL04586.1 hypothetical protein BO80DRAFT_203965 [Aspergillus ibericus CBS 121593]